MSENIFENLKEYKKPELVVLSELIAFAHGCAEGTGTAFRNGCLKGTC